MIGAAMNRNDQDLFRRLSVSLMGVALALALQSLRPALAAEQTRRPDGPPISRSGNPALKSSTQSATVGGRIRYAPDFGATAIAVPPLADGDGGDTVDCVAGCYASSRLAALEPQRTPLAVEASDKKRMLDAPKSDRGASRVSALQPASAPRLRPRAAKSRHGGSGDWFRRIDDARPAESAR